MSKELIPLEIASKIFTTESNRDQDIRLGLIKVYEIPNGFLFERDIQASMVHPKYRLQTKELSKKE